MASNLMNNFYKDVVVKMTFIHYLDGQLPSTYREQQEERKEYLSYETIQAVDHKTKKYNLVYMQAKLE